jgi:TRAP-type mannitol/chloroaromatic compound transport system permease large subunit
MAIKMKTVATYRAKAECPTHSRTEIPVRDLNVVIDDDRISLKDVFMGALPFALVMLIVLFILIEFPILSLALI